MSYIASAPKNTTEHASSTATASTVSTLAAETIYSDTDTYSVHPPSFTLMPLLATLVSLFIRISGCSYFMGGSSGVSGRENQDHYSVSRLVFKGVEYVISVVCDGHGKFGKTFATETTRRLPIAVLANFEAILANPLELQFIFNDVNEELRSMPFGTSTLGACASGGTTVTLSILCDGRQIVANLADCEAVTRYECDPSLITLNRDGIPQPTPTSPIVCLTRSHGPHDASELVRVRTCGARIRNEGRPVNADQQLGMYVVCPYSNLNLNLTRAFGDFHASFVIPAPTVTVVEFPPHTLTKTIICSDGCSNCFTHERPVEGFSAMNDLFTLSPAEICARGRNEAERLFGVDAADNTTILVLESGGVVPEPVAVPEPEPVAVPEPVHVVLPEPVVFVPVSILVSPSRAPREQPSKRVKFNVPDSPLPSPPVAELVACVCSSPQPDSEPSAPRVGPPMALRPISAAVRQAVDAKRLVEEQTARVPLSQPVSAPLPPRVGPPMALRPISAAVRQAVDAERHEEDWI